ncbi:gamma-glutamylcyclotransferase family protein [Tropicibacter sp. Alg240-R139]|uniref:gamma-glutamylcyclotransferase family protein n=1 Tax=Tropicibacter sp. Alg240-R139 TaxID=2305991 RepID=UPI0013DFFC53|nr:gamma-glutamylcyclotransferase family protein [Tropicibacter sp. Alg240-R139]
MTSPYFFGYGSLVNRATHDYLNPQPARLRGWRRAWRHTDLRPVAFLTAVPCEASEIDGLIAHVPNNDWAALDEREWAYDRHSSTQSISHNLPHPAEIAVYAVPVARQSPPDTRHPILLSYLDVVVQGYHQMFGLKGVTDFFATTDGWDAPILDDRAAPRYPRHQTLTPEETALVESHLADLNVKPIQPA